MTSARKIGLGTVQFGVHYGISNTNGQTSFEEVKRILDFGSNFGIQLVDTAASYGDAEKKLGMAGISKMKVVSKFMPASGQVTLASQLSQTLQDLRAQKIYGYLAHRPADVFMNPAVWAELLEFKSKGLVEKVGFSFNSPDEAEVCLKKEMIPDLVQVPFNYFDNRFRQQLIVLKEKGCEVHTRSAFLQGLFFTDTDKLDIFFEPFKKYITMLQQKYGEALSLHLLKFVCDQEFIDHVIIGVENVDQLRSNLKFLALTSSLPRFDEKFPESILMPMNWPAKK